MKCSIKQYHCLILHVVCDENTLLLTYLHLLTASVQKDRLSFIIVHSNTIPEFDYSLQSVNVRHKHVYFAVFPDPEKPVHEMFDPATLIYWHFENSVSKENVNFEPSSIYELYQASYVNFVYNSTSSITF